MILAAVVAGLIASGPSFDDGGYFKSADRDRVFELRAAAETQDEAEALLERRDTYTLGRVTAAYLFPPDAPLPDGELTGAGTFGNAVAMMERPPFDRWTWRLWINPRGERVIEPREG